MYAGLAGKQLRDVQIATHARIPQRVGPILVHRINSHTATCAHTQEQLNAFNVTVVRRNH